MSVTKPHTLAATHRDRLRRLSATAYSGWVWTVFCGVGATLCPLVLILPGPSRRRAAARLAGRAFLGLTGLRPRVDGLDRLPEGPCVLVANHASYLDGILLQSVLPPRFGFVIKREMTRVPLVHLFLRRLGSLFVDRFDTRRGSQDTRRFYRVAAQGEALAFFPEGTFGPHPGVRGFKLGAFQIAARVGMPVVPVAIRGSRWILPSGSWLPRPGRLTIHVAEVAWPARNDRDAATELRDACRERIVELSGEPDELAAKPGESPLAGAAGHAVRASAR